VSKKNSENHPLWQQSKDSQSLQEKLPQARKSCQGLQ
jgi:hypothetical protein